MAKTYHVELTKTEIEAILKWSALSFRTDNIVTAKLKKTIRRRLNYIEKAMLRAQA